MPPSGDGQLTTAQQGAVQKVLSFLASNQYDQSAIKPHLQELVDEITAVCDTEENQYRMAAELDRLVRWQRLPGYWLSYLFQLSMYQCRSSRFAMACQIYSYAQINLNDDLALDSLETGYKESVLQYQRNAIEPIRKIKDNFRDRMRLFYRYYRTWYTPRPYSEVNPLTEHLYSEMTSLDLRMAFPEMLRSHSRLTADDYRGIIDRCKQPDDIYYRVIAGRFLGCEYSGQHKYDEAIEQYRQGLDDALRISLDTEIGHLHRLYGYALMMSGHLDEAAIQQEQASAHERHPAFLYWHALSQRELGDVWLRMAGKTKSNEHLRHAALAYKTGRNSLELHLGGSILPAACAVKQQVFRSYTDYALQGFMYLRDPEETFAEIEAGGPRYASEVTAESQAMLCLPENEQAAYRKARAVYHDMLAAINVNSDPEHDFSGYIAFVEARGDEERTYERMSLAMKPQVTRARTSDEIVEKVLGLSLPDTVFLMFNVGERMTFGALVDVNNHVLWEGIVGEGETGLRKRHEAYHEALRDAKGCIAAVVEKRNSEALDTLLDYYDKTIGPFLEPVLPILKGRQVKIFPRLFLGEVPLHAVKVCGKPLIEYCDVSYAPTLSVFLRVHREKAPPSHRTIVMVFDDKGTPAYNGTIRYMDKIYHGDLHPMPNPSWEELKSSVKACVPTDILFACHGDYLPDNPSASCLHLGKAEGVKFSTVFSELGLTGCECVAMGACESGLARMSVTAEYIGLPLAFFASGARYVIGSLWKVNNLSTAILLSFYFELLRSGECTVPGALNAAQRVVKQMSKDEVFAWVRAYLPEKAGAVELVFKERGDRPFAHPHFWAGFYVAGDV